MTDDPKANPTPAPRPPEPQPRPFQQPPLDYDKKGLDGPPEKRRGG